MKQNTTKPTAVITELPKAATIKVIKISSCHNISGKHKLTYQIGCNESQDVCFRVIENSGGGYFSSEWVSLSSIKECLANAPQPVTSFAFSKLFLGKSTNTPAFLLAALVNEELLKPRADKQRGYEIFDNTVFMAEVCKLIASDIDLKVAATPITKTT